jgi:hypothetical protein
MATRTVTRTGTVTITGREYRLGQLLAAIAAANANGQRPSKADVVGRVPSSTRADHYRAIDELIARHLVDAGQAGGRYQLDVTDAGRQVLATGSAEVTWEETEYGTIRWWVTEHICDGAAFTSFYDDRPVAVGSLAHRGLAGSHVRVVTLTEMWEAPGGVREPLTREPIWQADGDRCDRCDREARTSRERRR